MTRAMGKAVSPEPPSQNFLSVFLDSGVLPVYTESMNWIRARRARKAYVASILAAVEHRWLTGFDF